MVLVAQLAGIPRQVVVLQNYSRLKIDQNKQELPFFPMVLQLPMRTDGHLSSCNRISHSVIHLLPMKAEVAVKLPRT